MDGFRLDFRVGDGWIQTGLQSWRWMDLDWSLDLSLDWIQTEIGQDIPVILVKVTPGQSNTKTRQQVGKKEEKEKKERETFSFILFFQRDWMMRMRRMINLKVTSIVYYCNPFQQRKKYIKKEISFPQCLVLILAAWFWYCCGLVQVQLQVKVTPGQGNSRSKQCRKIHLQENSFDF